MSEEELGRPYDAGFIATLVERFHRYTIDDADAEGLVGMLGPVDALAESASGCVGFDDEPGDFLRVLHAERGCAARGEKS
jgi:hypothetical protein